MVEISPVGGSSGIIRKDPTVGVEKVITVNYNKIATGKHPELNIPLQPGDTILVP